MRRVNPWPPILGLVALVSLALAGLTIVTPIRAADNESAGLTGAVAPGYKLDRQEAAFRTGLSADDAAATTLSDANLASAGEFRVLGRANIPVSARFTDAGQSCKVRLVSAWKSDAGTVYVTGISDEVTLTASGLQRSSRYVAPTYVFDSYGARVAFVILTDDPATGSVDLWVGSY